MNASMRSGSLRSRNTAFRRRGRRPREADRSGRVEESVWKIEDHQIQERESIISLGDDLKAAATDCLKKCATLFGVGLHLYFDVPQSGNGNGQGNGNGAGHGNGHHYSENPEGNGFDSGRLTAKQLSAIFSLAKARGWSNKQIRDFVQEMFGKLPDFLNKREASAVVQQLQGGHDAFREHRYSTLGMDAPGFEVSH